ncbi:MAG: hypothetical protein P1P60_10245, partial [Treponema phagedenis]|uniref:hypothetical protein n=1 Tax=Treponema phagedenis TaxID=162 RepID=UPI003133F81D
SKTSPLQNSTRCLKASTQNCKIEAFKLVGEVKRISKTSPLRRVGLFYNRKFSNSIGFILPRTAKLRTM